MLILTHDTVRNPDILEVRQLPRKFFGRVVVLPKGGVGPGLALRMIAEFQLLRYTLALAPFVIVGILWRDTAMPLAQAPLFMLLLIWLVEDRLLRPSPKRRKRLINAADAERGLDLLRVQGRRALTRIAALRGQRAGELRLVVEQSELSALPPLTYVTVQAETGPHGAEVLSLDAEERAVLREELFRPPLDERLLQRINGAENVFIREVKLDARGVSAHARLAAALDGGPPAPRQSSRPAPPDRTPEPRGSG
jgi:hypothetical protein